MSSNITQDYVNMRVMEMKGQSWIEKIFLLILFISCSRVLLLVLRPSFARLLALYHQIIASFVESLLRAENTKESNTHKYSLY